MVEYEITAPDLGAFNLTAKYQLARSKYLTQAVERSVGVMKSAVQSSIPTGATGDAVGSVGSHVYLQPSRIVGRVQSSFRRPTIYIYVLNWGRFPGKKPPPSAQLVPWVLKKGFASDPKSAERVAFVIARSIARKGNRHPPYTRAAFDRVKPQVDAFHQQAVDQIVQELGYVN
jgi:hypothetical protein